MSMQRRLKKLATSAFAALVVVAGGSSHAGILSLSEKPLFLTNAVPPNVFFLLDDSGSMDWEILVEGENSGGRGQNTRGQQFSGIAYAFPHASNLYSSRSYRLAIEEFAQPGRGHWRFRSPDVNNLYYNPAITYTPWSGNTSASPPSPIHVDSPTDGAWIDPEHKGQANGTVDFEDAYDEFTCDCGSDELIASSRTGNYFCYDGDDYETATCTNTGDDYYLSKYYRWVDADTDGVVDNDEGALVEIEPGTTTYTGEGRTGRSDCANAASGSCSYDEELQNFANWFTYYRKRNYVAWSAIGQVINNNSAIRTGLFRFNERLFSSSGQSVFELNNANDKSTVLQELYCQTGTYCADASGTPAREAMALLGEFFVDEDQTDASDSPILDAASGGSCQQNFNITFTDGFWNSAGPGSQIGNDDGDDDTEWDGGTYADNQSDLLADIAMYYYENDLSPLDNLVPTIVDVDENSQQHLVTYGVAFGVAGSLDPFDTVTPGDPTDTDPTDPGFSWPTVTAGTDTTVDDLWHAAYNGRGGFLSAKNPAEVNKTLGATIQNISDRTSSSSSVALSSGFLNSGSLLFQARFDSSDWSGQLLAYDIVSSGADIGRVNALQWDAGCKLTGGLCTITGSTETGQNWNTGRQIFTYKPSSGKGIPFRWPTNPSSPGATDLDPDQITALKTNPDTAAPDTDAVGEQRLQFLRGATISGMRARTSLFGDVINSNPLYVGPPSFSYPDGLESAPYSTFVSSKQNRQPMIYVGANDGMLHGFVAANDSSGGTERIAYVPSEVYENLSILTSQNYGGSIGHRSYVDASPNAGDVFADGSWKTILAGGLGKGGQGIYALDVTDPSVSNFQETAAKAADLVLWEFTDANDSDLGFTYGQPAIVRLADGDTKTNWGVVIGNGYNNIDTNSGADSNVSSTGNGVIYVLSAHDGGVLKKFDTGVGTADDPTGQGRPNGVATAAPVDVDGDDIVDYIYAGDLFGNVWKLDVRDSNKSNWDFAYRTASAPQPFYVAKDSSGDAQPITTRLEVGLHPYQPGQVVLFGTGKYIEVGDNASTGQQTQTFYGIWDRNEAQGGLSVMSRTHLLQQQIIEETLYSPPTPPSGPALPDVETRISTTTPIAWHLTGGLPASGGGDLGWYMDLFSTENGNTNNFGERMVADPVLRDGKIIFVTLIPDPNPCRFGGDSWLMEVDAFSGARLPETPFDLSGDGLFSNVDWVTDNTGVDVVASGKKSAVGILPAPGILKDTTDTGTGSGREFKYFSGSSGDIEQVTESRGVGSIGRQSWRQIFSN